MAELDQRTVGYAEEADRAQLSQETSDFGDAVENLCIIRSLGPC